MGFHLIYCTRRLYGAIPAFTLKELICKKHRNRTVFFQFEIIINVFVSSF